MKRKKSRYNSTVGKLIFIIPLLVLGTVVVYTFSVLHSPGTLIVTAESSACENAVATSGGSCPPLLVQVTVNGKSGETPWTQSLTQGTYTVTYSALTGYYTPAAKAASVTPSITTYAVGVYDPITRVVQVTNSGFNETSIQAIHGITPVVWTNPSSSAVTIRGSPTGSVTIQPGETYTHVFTAAGTYNYTVIANGYEATNEVVTVTVS